MVRIKLLPSRTDQKREVECPLTFERKLGSLIEIVERLEGQQTKIIVDDINNVLIPS